MILYYLNLNLNRVQDNTHNLTDKVYCLTNKKSYQNEQKVV